jgi:hypothetical protein
LWDSPPHRWQTEQPAHGHSSVCRVCHRYGGKLTSRSSQRSPCKVCHRLHRFERPCGGGSRPRAASGWRIGLDLEGQPRAGGSRPRAASGWRIGLDLEAQPRAGGSRPRGVPTWNAPSAPLRNKSQLAGGAHRPLQEDRPLHRRHTVPLRGRKPNNGDAGRSHCGIRHHIGGKPRSQLTATRASVGFATDTVANSFRAVFSAARVRFATACTASSGLAVEDLGPVRPRAGGSGSTWRVSLGLEDPGLERPRAGGSGSTWRVSLELEDPRPEGCRPGTPRPLL